MAPSSGDVHNESTASGVAIDSSNIVFAVVATISLALRIYVRKFMPRSRLRREDWLAVLAWVFSLLLTISIAAGVSAGTLSSDSIGWPQVRMHNRAFVLIQFFYLAAVALSKLSMLAFFRRTLRTDRTPSVLIIFTNITWLWLAIFVILTFLQYKPFMCLWNADPSRQCGVAFASTHMYIAVSATDLVLCLSLFIIPIIFLRRLQMSPGRHTAMYVVLGFGLLCIVSSICHLAYSAGVVQVYLSSSSGITGQSEVWAKWWLWSGLEALFSSICVNLPYYGPLIPWDNVDSLCQSMSRRLVGGTPGRGKGPEATPVDRERAHPLTEAPKDNKKEIKESRKNTKDLSTDKAFGIGVGSIEIPSPVLDLNSSRPRPKD